MKKALMLFLLCLSTQVFAGSNEAKLICRSASGRTIFEAGLQDITAFNYAKFTIDKQSISWDENTKAAIIFDSRRKVFTIQIGSYGNEKWLTFYAIPSTFKTIKNTSNDEHYRFKAIIQGQDPREGQFHNSKQIELSCELTYSI